MTVAQLLEIQDVLFSGREAADAARATPPGHQVRRRSGPSGLRPEPDQTMIAKRMHAGFRQSTTRVDTRSPTTMTSAEHLIDTTGVKLKGIYAARQRLPQLR